MNSIEKKALDKVGPIGKDFIDLMVDALINDPSAAGKRALDFLEDKREVLTGIAATSLGEVFQSIAASAGDEGELLAAKRAYIGTLSLSQTIAVHQLSVQALEASAEPPFRLASIFSTILEYGAEIAPMIIKALLLAVGLGG